jgi:hypothetical protein
MLPASRLLPLLSSLFAGLLLLTGSLRSETSTLVEWSWTGGVTDTRATIVARSWEETLTCTVQPAPGTADQPAPATPLTGRVDSRPSPDGTGHLYRFTFDGLQPGTLYHGSFANPGKKPAAKAFQFQTFPPAGKPASFRVALGSCNDREDADTFTAALHQKPLFFLFTGDFHYADIGANDPVLFLNTFDTLLRAPKLSAMLRALPIAYVWDDHDFGPNGSDRHSPARPAAHANYRSIVPHYPLAHDGHAAPIDQAFTVGRVRFILSDLRSEKDRKAQRMMSPEQTAWLKKELLAAHDTHAYTFWVSSLPWNGPARPGGEPWGGNPDARRDIADFLKENKITRLCILAGDAHMTGIDDGTHSDFATGGGAPVPVFQAAPIHHKGSYKGGPYALGARFDREVTQKFGIIDVKDGGTSLEITLSGRDGSDGRGDQVLVANRDAEGKKIEWTFTVPVPPSPR